MSSPTSLTNAPARAALERRGRILSAQGWVDGVLHTTAQGRIARIEARPLGDAPLRYVLPGFMDLHVHGGGGADMMQGGDAAGRVARVHARHGTTSLLATTMTAPLNDVARALTAIGPFCQTRGSSQARVLGVHLEGPFISPERLGAQPDNACLAALEEVARLDALCAIRVLTLAPEMLGHMDLIPALNARGIRVQIGHSNGSYEQGVKALAQGASGFTHLFNAMSALHHREPGMVGAALAHADYAEIIPDLLHVHPGAIHAALRAIPHLYCVSDATSATDSPDGAYLLGSHSVHKCLGSVRLANGTLAGSCLTMDQALRNLVSIGLSLEDASHRVSRIPAQYLGLDDRGVLKAGAWADVVELDAQLQVCDVFVEGEPVVIADA